MTTMTTMNVLNDIASMTCCGGGTCALTAAVHTWDEIQIDTNSNDKNSGDRGRSPTRKQCVNASFDVDSDDDDNEEVTRESRRTGNWRLGGNQHTAGRSGRSSGRIPASLTQEKLADSCPSTNQFCSPATTTNRSRGSNDKSKRNASSRTERTQKEKEKPRRHHAPWTRGVFRQGSSRLVDEKHDQVAEEEKEDDARDSSPTRSNAVVATKFYSSGSVGRTATAPSTLHDIKGEIINGRVISTSRSRSRSRASVRTRNSTISMPPNVCNIGIAGSVGDSEVSHDKRSTLPSVAPLDAIIVLTTNKSYDRKSRNGNDDISTSSKQTLAAFFLLQKIPRHLSRRRCRRPGIGKSRQPNNIIFVNPSE